MRKIPRKAVLENVSIFKRDAKQFELGQFDVISQESQSFQSINVNGLMYLKFINWNNTTALRSGAFNFKTTDR